MPNDEFHQVRILESVCLSVPGQSSLASKGKYWLVEEKLKTSKSSKFMKYNTNTPDQKLDLSKYNSKQLKIVQPYFDLAEAYSCFSYWFSKKNETCIIICDVQGVANTFTDLQVLATEGYTFGCGNVASETSSANEITLEEWMDGHTCNSICKIFKDANGWNDASVASSSSDDDELPEVPILKTKSNRS